MKRQYIAGSLRDVKVKNPKTGRMVHKAWKGTARYAVPNPSYIDKPVGEDTRTANEKRKVIWKQLAKTFDATECRTKSQANAALQEWVKELNELAETDTDSLLISYMRRYVDDREAAGIIEPSTGADYRHTITRLEKRFSDTKLCELTADDVQRFQTAELKRGVAPTTCGKAYRLLKQVCTHATKRGAIKQNPMLLVDPPKRPKKQPNGLDIAEAQRLTGILINMNPTPVCVAAFLALHASLRAGEACGLQWRDVDIDAHTIRVSRAVGLANGAYLKSPKNDSSTRVVEITDDLAHKLIERRECMLNELKSHDMVMSEKQFGELYVCGTITGKYLNPQLLGRYWLATAQAFDIVGTQGKRATFHTLRHGFATVAVASGIDIASIAAQMGHSTVSMTLNTYASATAAGKKRAAATLGNVLHPTGTAKVYELDRTGTEG